MSISVIGKAVLKDEGNTLEFVAEISAMYPAEQAIIERLTAGQEGVTVEEGVVVLRRTFVAPPEVPAETAPTLVPPVTSEGEHASVPPPPVPTPAQVPAGA